jgi:hypothetical protein
LLEPGPVVLLTTSRKGRANVMTMSWHMMVEFEPPLVACVVGNADYSFATLRATRECVIAIPAWNLAQKVVDVGNCSGRDVAKFETCGLTPQAGKSDRAAASGGRPIVLRSMVATSVLRHHSAGAKLVSHTGKRREGLNPNARRYFITAGAGEECVIIAAEVGIARIRPSGTLFLPKLRPPGRRALFSTWAAALPSTRPNANLLRRVT